MLYSKIIRCATSQVCLVLFCTNQLRLKSLLDPGIIALLPDRPPQVTFSCDTDEDSCLFQFWVNRVESFYCSLDTCQYGVEHGYDANRTKYECENIKCSCIPGRFICGEAGSVGESLLVAHSHFTNLYRLRHWRIP